MMLTNIKNEVNFILSVKKLSVQLDKYRSDYDVDNIKKLFINNMSLLNESSSLSELINLLIVLSEKEVNSADIEDFIGLMSIYWTELLQSTRCCVLFFGCHKNFNTISTMVSENIVEIKHIHIDKNTSLDEIITSVPTGTHIIAIYDDAGSFALKYRGHFEFLDFIYMNELFHDFKGKTMKEEIAHILNKHKLLIKKHDVLLPLHEFIIDRKKMYSIESTF
ncbi:hypothetical protein [Buttiauxella gaviniae]|uniref:hypothetical protein n=1 Tax=Buttiauxella gaviniae TaxID=82990 RepID=UPI003975DEDC